MLADMARIARQTHAELHVLVDVDLGLKRCGVQPGEPAVASAKQMVESGLRFQGGPDWDTKVTCSRFYPALTRRKLSPKRWNG